MSATVSILNIATIATTDAATVALSLLALAAGITSAILYGRKRRWLDVTLVTVGAASLALALADIRLPTKGADAVSIAIATDTDGRISLPERPGLGVTLNMAVVDKYRV